MTSNKVPTKDRRIPYPAQTKAEIQATLFIELFERHYATDPEFQIALEGFYQKFENPELRRLLRQQDEWLLLTPQERISFRNSHRGSEIYSEPEERICTYSLKIFALNFQYYEISAYFNKDDYLKSLYRLAIDWGLDQIPTGPDRIHCWYMESHLFWPETGGKHFGPGPGWDFVRPITYGEFAVIRIGCPDPEQLWYPEQRSRSAQRSLLLNDPGLALSPDVVDLQLEKTFEMYDADFVFEDASPRRPRNIRHLYRRIAHREHVDLIAINDELNPGIDEITDPNTIRRRTDELADFLGISIPRAKNR